jgi:hypothetical protein
VSFFGLIETSSYPSWRHGFVAAGDLHVVS